MSFSPFGPLACAGLALALAAGAPHAARADADDARALVQAMSDYIAAQPSIGFDYDATLDVVTTDDQRLTLASSGAVALERPGKLRATHSGGFADFEMLFDGETFTLLGKDANLYTRIAIPGTVDGLIDALRDTYGRPLPAADLLTSDPYAALMADVSDAKDLGSGVVEGVECDFLAFRTDEVDWQIWIAQGDEPYPCRFAITSRTVPGAPEYAITVRNWRAGDAAAGGDFAFAAPDGATEIDIGAFQETVRELPDHFTIGDAQ